MTPQEKHNNNIRFINYLDEEYKNIQISLGHSCTAIMQQKEA